MTKEMHRVIEQLFLDYYEKYQERIEKKWSNDALIVTDSSAEQLLEEIDQEIKQLVEMEKQEESLEYFKKEAIPSVLQVIGDFKIRNLKTLHELKNKILEKQKYEQMEHRVMLKEHRLQDIEEQEMLEELRITEYEQQFVTRHDKWLTCFTASLFLLYCIYWVSQ